MCSYTPIFHSNINLLNWPLHAKSIHSEEPTTSKGSFLTHGVQGILTGGDPPAVNQQNGTAMAASELDMLPWQVTEAHQFKTQKRIFRSPER